MSSPAEAHREQQTEAYREWRLSETESRLNALIGILQTVGYGHGDSWEDREVRRHLESAQRLLEMTVRIERNAS